MGLGSTRVHLFAFSLTCVLFISFFCPELNAASESSRPADLVSNEKVIYTLPDVGFVTPESPLFFIKKIRDDILLLMPQEKESKIHLMIQMSDKYTVYADQMERSSKPKRASEMFESSFRLQESAIKVIKDLQKEHEDRGYITLAVQSNIKQAEIIRLLLDDVSSSEQSTLIQHLNTNMILRKQLQSL